MQLLVAFTLLSTHMHVRIEFCSEAFYHLSPDMRYILISNGQKAIITSDKNALKTSKLFFLFFPIFDKKRIYDLCNDELSIDFIRTYQGFTLVWIKPLKFFMWKKITNHFKRKNFPK